MLLPWLLLISAESSRTVADSFCWVLLLEKTCKHRTGELQSEGTEKGSISKTEINQVSKTRENSHL